MNSAAENWLSAINAPSLSPPIAKLLAQTGLTGNAVFPDTDILNVCVKAWHGSWRGPIFRKQGDFAETESRYYEVIIAEDGVVPTREANWHDLFNALIWLQFPLTKQYLNQLHVDDIRQHGAHPRTARRNHITHFDECGIVLAVPTGKLKQGNELLADLALHNWKGAFVDKKTAWFDALFPVIFGHANLEMLLTPFIGLTGKWLAVVVDDDFASMSGHEQSQCLDVALKQRCQALGDFLPKGVLKPLPILGIPGWYDLQTPEFYDDDTYFRPLRRGTGETVQLPLLVPPPTRDN
ncbi:DUF3025 domain-containing protein [Aestuariibacter sp. A3R04]|uniref:DUF3025 domain-containing protein n=1 Tax=Aestuariibacter sp. A3R04 TaxID=2841571 RepID=UPI001C0981E4|nr:DUF3025 domain-containing protein [Aestuariibacter sp. A3R04]MBU3022382.1 DUF3025 domain-containing protein [Aestuariibacter sp. A3R04]